MGLQDIIIKIRSAFDGKGTSDAQRGLDGVGQAAGKVDAGARNAAGAVVKGQEAMSAMGAAAAASSGSISGVASALGQLAPKLQGLSAALPVVGLATAAFTAWKKVVDTLSESARAMRMDLMASMDEQMDNALERSATGYQRMREEMDAAAESRRMLTAAENAAEEARSRARIAALEAERAKAKAALAPGDEVGARRLDAQFDARVAAEKDSARTASLARSRESVLAEQADAQREETEILDRMRYLQEEGNAQRKRLSALIEKSETAMDRQDNRWTSVAADFYNPGNALTERRRKNAAAEYAPSMKEAEDRGQKITNEMNGLQKKLADVRRRKLALEMSKEVQAEEESAAASDARRGGFERASRSASIEADARKAREEAAAAAARERAEAERQRLRAQMRETQGGIDAYDRRVARETSDVAAAGARLDARPRGRVGHDGAEANFQRQIRELQAAIEARDRYSAAIADRLAQLRKQDEALANQLKRP